MSARDICEILTVYNYGDIKISVGDKNGIHFSANGNRFKCKKDEVKVQLSDMKDDELLFGVPKYFILDCIEKTPVLK